MIHADRALKHAVNLLELINSFRWKTFLKSICLLFGCVVMAAAQTTYHPSQENTKARATFQDNKFGVFIHWGLYSMLADGEWALNNNHILRDEYRKLASGFYPSMFDAKKWVSDIKASGAKYVCFTTRHCDGFSMFSSQHSDYNIVDATPFKRDVLKELADECRKQGLRLHLYYSLLDWDRDDYYPPGKTGQHTGRTGPGDWASYLDFMTNQLTELLTNYGDIAGIWFDGQGDKHREDAKWWNLDEKYALVHRLHPSCLIANNHHIDPFPGEDFQLYERMLPGENRVGLDRSVSQLPLECCETMNDNWGYHITDQNYKTTEQLIHVLVNAAGNNANLLLNVGPQPNGLFPEKAITRLHEVGEWMNVYGETIYETRGGVIKPCEWGVTTQRGRTLYVHILNHQEKILFLPYQGNILKKCVLFVNQKKIDFKQDKNGLLLILPEVPTDPDYVLELTFRDLIR